MGLQLRLRAALKVAVNTLVRVPLVMREPNVLGKLVYSICLEAADGTCNLALRVNVGLVSLKNISTLHLCLLGHSKCLRNSARNAQPIRMVCFLLTSIRYSRGVTYPHISQCKTSSLG